MRRAAAIAMSLLAVLITPLALAATAVAEDTLKIASGGHGNWDSSTSELGRRAGIFEKRGLDLDILYTAGGGETVQAVISGAVDIGVAVATGSAMAVYAKGAPIRVIGSLVTGTGDTYYYVRADSAPQKPPGCDRKHHDRLLHGRFLDQLIRARLDQNLQHKGQGDADRRPSGDPDAGYVRTGGRRLRHLTVRVTVR